MERFEKLRKKWNSESPIGNSRKGPWVILGPNNWENLVKVQRFVEDFAENSFRTKKYCVTFIDYNDMSILFFLEVKKRKFIIHVGQPNNPYGSLKKEYDNLLELRTIDEEHVIDPGFYYTNRPLELYMENYIEGARILNQKKLDFLTEYALNKDHSAEVYGMQKKEILRKAIIAVLVSTYHDVLKKGVGNVKLTNGDFLLDRKMETLEFCEETILKHIQLYEARTLIPMSFEDYRALLFEEFRNPSKKGNLIHTSGSIYFEDNELEDGIALGLSLRKNRR